MLEIESSLAPMKKMPNGIQKQSVIKPYKSSKVEQKLPKLLNFRQRLQKMVLSGQHDEDTINELHVGQQEKEIIDNMSRMDSETQIEFKPVANPIEGHEVSKEYRTKMLDWMVEVCTTFKCSKRTYFVAVQIFDKYLTRCGKNQNRILQNKDVHSIGVTSMFIASKYEDVDALSSKKVSEKIAHRAIASREILKKEAEFLNLFEFEIDFITHYDFYHTYRQKLANKTKKESINYDLICADLLDRQALLLVKMAI